MAESIAEFFLEHFREHARESAYAQRRGYRTEKVTYGQVLGHASHFAQELQRREITKGDRIMLWAENSAVIEAGTSWCQLETKSTGY